MKLALRRTASSLLTLLISSLCVTATAQTAAHSNPADQLKVYFVDVEGGQSTLFITPAGQSLLIDTGWQDHAGRDAERIAAVARQAGLSRIDNVLLTHYHEDHVGGVPQLVARIPVGTFIDHGPNREIDHGITEQGYAKYQTVLAAGKSKRLLAHVGEVLPIQGMTVRVISADGSLLANPLPGAGAPNPFCKISEVRPPDKTENSRSLGVEITFGKLKILDLGDLTWDKEMQLMCPSNKLGHVDIYIVSHHGWYQSSSPALVDAIHPRVAIMDNGETKGGSTPTLKTIRQALGLQTLWQIHYSDEGGPANNTPQQYIANLTGTGSNTNADAGHFIELKAAPDGSFEVSNSRNNFTQEYPARR